MWNLSAAVCCMQLQGLPAGGAVCYEETVKRSQGLAWEFFFFFSPSHSSYADRHTTWRTRIVGRRARIQRINCGGFTIQGAEQRTLHPGQHFGRIRCIFQEEPSLSGSRRKKNWLRSVGSVSQVAFPSHPPTPLTLLSVPGVWRQGPGWKTWRRRSR